MKKNKVEKYKDLEVKEELQDEFSRFLSLLETEPIIEECFNIDILSEKVEQVYEMINPLLADISTTEDNYRIKEDFFKTISQLSDINKTALLMLLYSKNKRFYDNVIQQYMVYLSRQRIDGKENE